MNEIDVLLNLANKVTVVALTLGFLAGFWKGWWVFGREYNDMRRQRDELKEIAYRATGIAETAVRTVEKKA